MTPVEVRTARLLLRPPRPEDACEIFSRYASDPEVTKFLAWPRHVSVEAARGFVQLSAEQWRSHGCGPYLIRSLGDGTLLGSTGLQFETGARAVTGYVLAADAWGRGYATEALNAMVDAARAAPFATLDAFCHVDHRASARVLEKCGFAVVETIPDEMFPNLDPPRAGALHYRLALR